MFAAGVIQDGPSGCFLEHGRMGRVFWLVHRAGLMALLGCFTGPWVGGISSWVHAARAWVEDGTTEFVLFLWGNAAMW